MIGGAMPLVFFLGVVFGSVAVFSQSMNLGHVVSAGVNVVRAGTAPMVKDERFRIVINNCHEFKSVVAIVGPFKAERIAQASGASAIHIERANRCLNQE